MRKKNDQLFENFEHQQLKILLLKKLEGEE